MRTLKAFLLSLLIAAPCFASDTPPNIIPSDGNGVPVSVEYFQYGAQDVRAHEVYQESTLRASAVLLGATGRENSTAVTGLESYRVAFIHLDVTALTRPGTDETLDVVVETSYDGGTTWLRIARFTTLNTAGAQTQTMVLSNADKVTPVANLDDTDPASGAISIGVFGDRLRVASTYTDAAGADGTCTFSVKAFFKR